MSEETGNTDTGTGVQHRHVTADEDGMRLDRWFKAHFPQLSHGQLEKLLRKGQIRVGGSRAKASTRVEKGQKLRIPPMPAGATTPKPKSSKQRAPTAADRKALDEMTVFEDDAVLVINKPAGLAVQGGSNQTKHLDAMLRAKEKNGEAPRLVHRLDKDTSGVMVLGKTAGATRKLASAFRARDSFKLYWALTAGVPTPLEGDIDAALAKSGAPGREKMGADDEDGKRAVTRYATIDHAGKQSAWLALRPITGRTHQLRVHLSLIERPILGDRKYGGPEARLNDIANKLHLHAQRLILPHPVRGMIDVEAPPPPHFVASLKTLGFALVDGPSGYERLLEAEGL